MCWCTAGGWRERSLKIDFPGTDSTGTRYAIACLALAALTGAGSANCHERAGTKTTKPDTRRIYSVQTLAPVAIAGLRLFSSWRMLGKTKARYQRNDRWRRYIQESRSRPGCCDPWRLVLRGRADGQAQCGATRESRRRCERRMHRTTLR